ncbi:MAG: hypothetical protein AAFW60_08770, partial [Pseudomonadota bacterium]
AMKHCYLFASAALVLGACWGAPPNEKILSQQCFDLFDGDARTEGMVANDARTDLAGFCACYGAKVVATPELIDLHKDILVSMNEAKGEGNNVEAAAEQIEAMTQDGRIDTFTEDDLDALGDYFRDLTVDMSGADGSCPA